MGLSSAETALPPVALSYERMCDGYRRGDETDSSLWLSLCGGGMAAAHNVGKAIAAEELGLREVVDGVCGDSAGAFIGAAFVTDQLDCTERAFVEELPTKGLIDFRRAIRWQRVLNLEVLERLVNEHLDTALIADPENPMFGFAYTNLRQQQPVFVYGDVTVSPEELREQLLWGAHMPLVAGIPPRDKNGDPVADAGLSLKATWEIAAAGGATHVIEGSTSVKHTWEKAPIKTFGVGLWMQVFGNVHGVARYRKFATEQIELQNQPLPPNIDVVYPKKGMRLAPTLTTDSKLVKRTVDAGYASMMNAYGREVMGSEPSPSAKENLVYFMGHSATAKTFALAVN